MMNERLISVRLCGRWPKDHPKTTMTAPAPPKLLRPIARDYRAFAYDARRWSGYVPRADDIVIATYPKCGTTWMQRLVSMLVFASTQPRPLAEVSPWIDRRFGADIATVHDRLAAQTHRRFIKSHLPLDALPLYDSVKYVHVARDGRDACMSFHNHSRSFTPEALANFDAIGLADETIGRTYPRVDAEFRRILSRLDQSRRRGTRPPVRSRRCRSSISS